MRIRDRKLTPEQEQYVDIHYLNKWAKAIAEELGVSSHLVRVYMAKKGYPLRKNCKQGVRKVASESKYFNVNERETWWV